MTRPLRKLTDLVVLTMLAVGCGGPVPSDPTGPTQVPVLLPPPIDLKFIGIIHMAGKQKIAVFNDGIRMHHGSEGEIVLGRCRMLWIGEESVDLAQPDGRGRHTLRLVQYRLEG
jgi:hypothetical protein